MGMASSLVESQLSVSSLLSSERSVGREREQGLGRGGEGKGRKRGRSMPSTTRAPQPGDGVEAALIARHGHLTQLDALYPSQETLPLSASSGDSNVQCNEEGERAVGASANLLGQGETEQTSTQREHDADAAEEARAKAAARLQRRKARRLRALQRIDASCVPLYAHLAASGVSTADRAFAAVTTHRAMQLVARWAMTMAVEAPVSVEKEEEEE